MFCRSQWLVFATADIVVSGHGAGLVNMFACAPSTRIVYLPVQQLQDPCYVYQAAALDLPMIVVPAMSSRYRGSYPALTDDLVAMVLRAVAEAVAWRIY